MDDADSGIEESAVSIQEEYMDINPDEVEGRVKEAAGDLTDNDDLKREGKVDKAAGKAKDMLDDAGDAAEEAIDKVRDAVQHN